LAEFKPRYSNRSKLGVEDAERAARALNGLEPALWNREW